MSETAERKDVWRAAAFGLWELFFFIGLFPEMTFRLLRAAGGVLPQDALINSPYMVTIGLAGYFTAFAYNQCRRLGLAPGKSADMTLQYAVIALVAFLPVDFWGVIQVAGNALIQNKATIYISTAAKIVAWGYLSVMVCRYYLGNDASFVNMPSLFPSTRRDRP